jgi:tRNA dimethylallyltransferase
VAAPCRFFLLGPTASGKTAVALALAPQLNAEILSMDSMLVYQAMDLGTAKPSAKEQAQVPHHLIDLVSPKVEFSVARWLAEAERVEGELVGKNSLFVGGTNLYLKAITAGLMDTPDLDPAELSRLESTWKEEGGAAKLWQELRRVDLATAEKIHPNDQRRIFRALAVWRGTGRPLSSWQEQWQQTPPDFRGVALAWPREVLRERVARRFQEMLESGFVEEVAAIQKEIGFSKTAAKALGYAQILDFLNGRCSLEEASEKAITLTRTYIRRQMTWLRSFPDLHWLDMENKSPELIAEEAAILLLPEVSP